MEVKRREREIKKIELNFLPICDICEKEIIPFLPETVNSIHKVIFWDKIKLNSLIESYWVLLSFIEPYWV